MGSQICHPEREAIIADRVSLHYRFEETPVGHGWMIDALGWLSSFAAKEKPVAAPIA